MFKSISFALLIGASISAQATNFEEIQETTSVFSTIIFKSETVLKDDFKNELTALPTDFVYGSQTASSESTFERFNEDSIAKQLSLK